MLALIAMDKPKAFSASDVRKERAAILAKLARIKGKKLGDQVKGQYAGYVSEDGVSPQSTTETYFRLEAFIDSPRWKGVPFYLESGKGMAEAKTEIDIYFKESKKQQAKSKDLDPEQQNILTFRIQPDEGIKVRFFVKSPGYGFATEPKTLKFKYSDSLPTENIPNDYERLIHDAFIGDQTLFASTDEIMESWKFITPLIEQWNKVPLKLYERGAKEVE